ncbi:unnamed protein product [Cylindrotheca closterium]|uniref:Menorin-like domain-containing protein n=1 Tax=Cylindrotheca closterium TaxID=2856 RepID=A0AAD2CV66_9STRA|nr:unnamed protein product [Cylindrotheca closterium]
MLPPPKQSWSHSTCTIDTLKNALSDDSITAIESDILMGTVVESSDPSSQSSTSQPIMAHPPDTTSDLSFEKFIKLSLDEGGQLKKHLKLDIKEAECIGPILTALKKRPIAKDSPRIIYFNADILPGPAVRSSKCIEANMFIEKCLKFIQQDGNPQNYAFSLGWKTDCRSFFGYTPTDVAAMQELMEQHQLSEKSLGVVLAVNARVLAKRVGCFDELLKSFPSCQLLIWTGTGEPAISSFLLQYLKGHYESIGYSGRVGFDCQVESNPLKGIFVDVAVKAVSVWWNTKKTFQFTLEALYGASSTTPRIKKND